MSDVIDRACDREEQDRQLALAHTLSKAVPRLPDPTGECVWCGDHADPGQVFCSKDCALEYREMDITKQRAARINGGQQ